MEKRERERDFTDRPMMELGPVSLIRRSEPEMRAVPWRGENCSVKPIDRSEALAKRNSRFLLTTTHDDVTKITHMTDFVIGTTMFLIEWIVV